jgi:hypothetical protein
MPRALLDLRHSGRMPVSFASRLRAKHRARRWVLRELDRLEAEHLEAEQKTEKNEC